MIDSQNDFIVIIKSRQDTLHHKNSQNNLSQCMFVYIDYSSFTLQQHKLQYFQLLSSQKGTVATNRGAHLMTAFLRPGIAVAVTV